MNNVLEIDGLTKTYDRFKLDSISFALPEGSIMGFIGENGAGKTTTIKLILNIIRRDKGNIRIFGRDNLAADADIKQDIGVVLDDISFPDSMTPRNINQFMRHIYRNWDQNTFFNYLDRFGLPQRNELKS